MKSNVIQKRFEATTINGLRAALVVYVLGVLLQASGMMV